jgi:hypothetical protein
MITIAEHCIDRLSIDRALLIGPGFIIRERPIRDRPTIKYLCINGNKTTRAAIARKYHISYKCVNDSYTRNNEDWPATHAALKAKFKPRSQ